PTSAAAAEPDTSAVGSPAVVSAAMAFQTICISRDVGAGGEQVGRSVADSLGFCYVDEDIVRAAAERAGVEIEDVSSAEQRRTVAGRLLDLVAQAGAPEAYAY